MPRSRRSKSKRIPCPNGCGRTFLTRGSAETAGVLYHVGPKGACPNKKKVRVSIAKPKAKVSARPKKPASKPKRFPANTNPAIARASLGYKGPKGTSECIYCVAEGTSTCIGGSQGRYTNDKEAQAAGFDYVCKCTDRVEGHNRQFNSKSALSGRSSGLEMHTNSQHQDLIREMRQTENSAVARDLSPYSRRLWVLASEHGGTRCSQLHGAAAIYPAGAELDHLKAVAWWKANTEAPTDQAAAHAGLLCKYAHGKSSTWLHTSKQDHSSTAKWWARQKKLYQSDGPLKDRIPSGSTSQPKIASTEIETTVDSGKAKSSAPGPKRTNRATPSRRPTPPRTPTTASNSSAVSAQTRKPMTDQMATVINGWRDQMLQFNRNNRLLYFRPGTGRDRRSIKILNRRATDLLVDIEERERLQFDYIDPASVASLRAQRRRGEDIEIDLDGIRIQEGDLDCDGEVDDLQRRLGLSSRSAKEWNEEQGVNILHLALGFISWEDEEKQTAKAPLMLLPVNLDRASPRDAYYLSLAGEDIEFNQTLIVYLNRTYNLDIVSEDSDNFSSSDPNSVIDRIRQQFEQDDRFEVTSEIYLSTFQFSKLPMARDLEALRDDGSDNEIVRALAGEPPDLLDRGGDGARVDLSDSGESYLGGRLDDLLELRDQYTIVDADYSQLATIENVRGGENLVIHGPPGTGKSQTISNLIAGLIADGKTVLFVSEKKAALEVVMRTMEREGIGDFCLDLHSRKDGKKYFYDQIKTSVNSQRMVSNAKVDISGLKTDRDALNEHVRALHEIRSPLGRSVFWAHGEYATTQTLPALTRAFPNVGDLDEHRLTQITQAAENITARAEHFESHHDSLWRPLVPLVQSISLGTELRSLSDQLASNIDSILTDADGISQEFGLLSPQDATEIAAQIAVLGRLSEPVAVPGQWADTASFEIVNKLATEQAARSEKMAVLSGELSSRFGGSDIMPAALEVAKPLELTDSQLALLGRYLGDRFELALVQSPVASAAIGTNLQATTHELSSAASAVTRLLGADEYIDRVTIDSLLETISEIVELAPVPVGWVENDRRTSIQDSIGQARHISGQISEVESRLIGWDHSILESIDQEMLVRFRTSHQGRFRVLKPSYRRDRQLLRAAIAGGAQTGRPQVGFSEEAAIVEDAVTLRSLTSEFEVFAQTLPSDLGPRYRGRDTDWGSVTADFDRVAEISDRDWVSGTVVLKLLSEPSKQDELSRAAEELSRTHADFTTALLNNSGSDGEVSVAASEYSVNNPSVRDFSAVEAEISELNQIVQDIAGLVQPFSESASIPFTTLDEVTTAIANARDLHTLRGQESADQSQYAQSFGDLFTGDTTNWGRIEQAVRWAESVFSNQMVDRTITRFQEVIEEQRTPGKLLDAQAALTARKQSLDESVASLETKYSLATPDAEDWNSRDLKDIASLARVINESADEANEWLRYQSAVSSLDSYVGSPILEEVRKLTNDADQVPGIVRRWVVSSWLDDIYKSEGQLGNFSTIDHETLRGRFARVDKSFKTAAKASVRRAALKRYPDTNHSSARFGQLALLNRQMQLKRRQMSVRRVMQGAGQAIQAYKPCFMMSPLAVSQILPLNVDEEENLRFDVVMFDEASQVHPYDAIPAIERGNQVVLAGDEHQLPPNLLWQRSLDDDEEEEEDETQVNQLAGMESILTTALASRPLFKDSYLKVHYRSRHESLIRFSNHHIYRPAGNYLLTFPSPGTLSKQGVIDEYLPDARYQVGVRTNRGEAEKVVELVFDHMSSFGPESSLGVVALSRAQADLIQRLIEERRVIDRGVEKSFDEELPEPFFVKNLENVQGDERDHMILCIGYGPTSSENAVLNRFGPINGPAGQRRLNVAVTRAKFSLTVVHSLLPRHITAQNDGARLLRRFLEYAENPNRLESEVEIDMAAEAESDFEQAVKMALEAKGHRIVSQVGESGYRIDLGVLAEDGLTIDLGIECDGATYHSSPAARDRDWLRQEVLEGLGWTIHRVWSTSWINNPAGELDRIESALSAVRSGRRSIADASGSKYQDNIYDERAEYLADVDEDFEDPLDIDSPEPELVAVRPESTSAFRPYREATIPKAASWKDLRHENSLDLAPLVSTIVEIEGPIHQDLIIERLRIAYNSGRVRGTTRDSLLTNLRLVVRNGPVEAADDFYWINDQIDFTESAPRRAGDRAVDQIHANELMAAVSAASKSMFGGGDEDVLRATVTQFGWARTGPKIRSILTGVIEQMRFDGLI